jgi:hypothetical protein
MNFLCCPDWVYVSGTRKLREGTHDESDMTKFFVLLFFSIFLGVELLLEIVLVVSLPLLPASAARLFFGACGILAILNRLVFGQTGLSLAGLSAQGITRQRRGAHIGRRANSNQECAQRKA